MREVNGIAAGVAAAGGGVVDAMIHCAVDPGADPALGCPCAWPWRYNIFSPSSETVKNETPETSTSFLRVFRSNMCSVHWGPSGEKPIGITAGASTRNNTPDLPADIDM